MDWSHSLFLAGGPVVAAGFFETDVKGAGCMISNESGHYTPTFEEMVPVIRDLYQIFKYHGEIIYESHDKASIGIIRFYRLEDAVARDKVLENDKSSLVIDTQYKSSHENKNCNEEKYLSDEDEFDDELGDAVKQDHKYSHKYSDDDSDEEGDEEKLSFSEKHLTDSEEADLEILGGKLKD